MLRRSCTWLTRSVSNVSRPATGPRRDERRAQQVWPCLYRACAHARGPATARLSFSEDEASMCIHMIKARGVAPARHSCVVVSRPAPGGVRRTISSILQPRVGSYVLRIIFLCDTLALSSWYCSSASWLLRVIAPCRIHPHSQALTSTKINDCHVAPAQPHGDTVLRAPCSLQLTTSRPCCGRSPATASR